MVDFRKMFPVLVVVLLLGALTASAQTTAALTCASAAGVTPTLRAEGLTELAGDLVLNCTGGDPANPFIAQVQIYANTNITSRLLAANAGYNESLLILNDPKPTAAGSWANPLSIPPVGTAATYATLKAYNTFRGQKVSDSAVMWSAVPITPPGTNGTFIIRITNIRVDASRLLPAGSTSTGLLPQQLIVYISINGTTTVPVNPSQQVLGYVQSAMTFAVTNCANSADAGTTNYRQCGSANTTILSAGRTNSVSFGIRFTENFLMAFKDKSTPVYPATGSAGTILSPFNGQSVAGVASNQNSEVGFVGSVTGAEAGYVNNATRLITRWTNVPKGVDVYVATGNTYFYGVNTADVSGTYSTYGGSPTLAVSAITSFDAYGAGGTAVTPLTAGTSSTTGTMSALTSRFPTCSTSDPSITLSPNVSRVTVGGVSVNQVTFPGLAKVEMDANGSGTAVWEVTASSNAAIETAWLPVVLVYSSNLSAGTPALGTANVYGVLGPAYPTTVAANVSTYDYVNGGFAYPRFADVPPASRLRPFAIVICQTSILFPYVTNAGGFDTGVALVNTSRDPFSSANANEGTCEINYYGKLADGSALTKTRETSGTVAAGSYLTFTLSGATTDSKVTGNPGFTGYLIVRCNFFYAHGYAFVSDAGAAKLAHGYIALIMDGDTANNASNRGSAAERLNN